MSDDTPRVGALPYPAENAPSEPSLSRLPAGGGEPVYDDLLAELDQALTAETEFEPLTLAVEKRPGVSIRYATYIDDDLFKQWRRNAEDKKSPSGYDSMRLMTQVLAHQCEAFLINGREPREDDGSLLTFRSPRIKKLAQQPANGRPQDAVRPLIANDPHVFSHGNAVLEAAGYGEEARKLDPTEG